MPAESKATARLQRLASLETTAKAGLDATAAIMSRYAATSPSSMQQHLSCSGSLPSGTASPAASTLLYMHEPYYNKAVDARILHLTAPEFVSRSTDAIGVMLLPNKSCLYRT
jgi:hypothetical protein